MRKPFVRSNFVVLFLLGTLTAHFCLVDREFVTDSLEKDYGKVVHASLIFRHGDRNPEFTFPTDEYRNYSWKGGFAGLTDVGKRRMVELGKWFRVRYGHVINGLYSPKLVKAESSSIDRAIMSGQCFLYGFYPTTDADKWLDDEKWQPIPIYTIARDRDNMIANLRHCNRHRQLVDKILTPIYEQFKDTIHSIETNTGLNFKNDHMGKLFHTLEQLEDTFLIYGEHNFTLPPWASAVFPEPLQTIVTKTQRSPAFSVGRSRLATGPLLESIIRDMRRKIENDNFEQMLHLYSGHDVTIRRSMIGLRAYDGQRIPYGSTLIFELRRKENATYYVTVSLKNSTYQPPYLLKIPGCEGLNCSYRQFEQLTRILVPTNWEKECTEMSRRIFSRSPYIILLLFISAIIFILHNRISANNVPATRVTLCKS